MIVSHPPLFPTIPLTNVVIDNLHLFLRVLINLLIVELRRQDAIDKVTKFSSFDPVKYFRPWCPQLPFYTGQNSKQLKIRTLTGPEKHKVISSIRMCTSTMFIPHIATDTCIFTTTILIIHACESWFLALKTSIASTSHTHLYIKYIHAGLTVVLVFH